jgi:hypothetical protein
MAKNNVQAELTLLDKLTAPLKAAAAQVSASTKQMNTAFNSVSNAFNRVNQVMLAITAVLAGGAAFKSAIDESINYRLEINKLSKALGTTLLEATALKEALDDLGMSSDVLANSARALGIKVNSSGKSLQDFVNHLTGSKDTINNYADAIMSVITKAQQMEDGTKRNQMLQEAFGRSYLQSLGLLRLTRDELAKVTEQVRGNEEVTKEQVEQVYAFKKAQEAGSDTIRDFKLALGDQLMPVIADFSEGLSGNKEDAKELGKIIGKIVIILYGSLIVTIQGVISAVQILTAAFDFLADTFRLIVSLIEAVSLALVGKFAEAWNVAATATKKYADETVANYYKAGGAIDTYIKKYIETGKKMGSMLSGKAPKVSAPKQVDEDAGGAIPATDEESKKNLEERTQLLEAESNRIKSIYAGRTTWMRDELKKQLELELRNLSNLRMTDEDRLKYKAKINKDLSALRQEGIQEQLALDQAAAKQELTVAQQNNAFTLAQAKSNLDKQQISLEQFLAKKKELHDADLVAEQTYLDKMLELAKGNAIALQNLENEKATQALQARLTKEALEQEAMQKEKGRLEELQSILVSSFQQSLDGILSGTMSFSEAMANIWQGIGNIFNKIIWQMVEDWIKAEALKIVTGLKTATVTAAANVSSAAVSSGAKATETSLSITNDAAKGTAAAIAAWASKNPIAAIAIGAIIGAAIYSLLGNVKSAKGGYANVEMDGQMAQLHKGEMVLPQPLAEGIRNIVATGQASAASGSVTYNIQAMDASSFDSYLKANASSVFSAHKLALRNGSQFA